jgi:hypothetical protein
MSVDIPALWRVEVEYLRIIFKFVVPLVFFGSISFVLIVGAYLTRRLLQFAVLTSFS